LVVFPAWLVARWLSQRAWRIVGFFLGWAIGIVAAIVLAFGVPWVIDDIPAGQWSRRVSAAAPQLTQTSLAQADAIARRIARQWQPAAPAGCSAASSPARRSARRPARPPPSWTG
jgi:hypothetical protein